DWVGTWTASPQPVWAPDFLAPPKVPRNLWNQTVRELAHVSIGGSKIRLLLTNEYTTYPITLGSVHAAISEKGAAIVPASDRAVVTFGDSITDGDGSSVDANARWPDNLARRLSDRKIAVLNEGISGAKVLSDRMGVNALARFERDVLDQPHAEIVTMMMGIND